MGRSPTSMHPLPPGMRREVLRRDGYQCVKCGSVNVDELEVDHVTPVALGGATADPANLQSLCVSCHVAKTRAENQHPARREWIAFLGQLECGA